MTCYQRAHVRSQLIRALRQLGGRTMQVLRAQRDPNGMPTGTKTLICTLYGIRYQQHAATLTLGLDLPGVLAGQSAIPRIVAVLMDGDPPQTGDLLDGKIEILNAEEQLGIVYLGLGGDKV